MSTLNEEAIDSILRKISWTPGCAEGGVADPIPAALCDLYVGQREQWRGDTPKIVTRPV